MQYCKAVTQPGIRNGWGVTASLQPSDTRVLGDLTHFYAYFGQNSYSILKQ